jgi:hypothetical protein
MSNSTPTLTVLPSSLSNFSYTATIISVGEPGATSVHKALEIPEILGYVYEQLERADMKGTLASMAQVCRAFTEQALDVLWRKLIGLRPLLSILPITVSGGVMVCHRYVIRLFN